MRHVFLLLAFACNSNVKTVPIEPATEVVTDLDGDGYSAYDGDCDDSDGSVNIGAEETCDGIDNNCDGAVDEGVKTTFYADSDGDGFGNAQYIEEACDSPEGYVPNGNDCDDTNIDIYPSADEICDGLDNDCNDLVDDGLGLVMYQDSDFDGFGDPDLVVEGCQDEPGLSGIAGDCDDSNPALNPDAAEACDELDNNCDGAVDEGAQETYYLDADSDGFGDLNSTEEACSRPAGYSENSNDCDDGDSAISPSASEICDGIDNNCDSLIDDSSSVNQSTYYSDTDGDGFGDASSSVESCFLDAGFSENDQDCDDSDLNVNPDASEVCDGFDNDCDGDIDDGDSLVSGASSWYLDADMDGFGNSAFTMDACMQPSGFVADSSDCNDIDAAVNPDASEVCDEIDNDCNGDIDDADPAIQYSVDDYFYADTDGDGFGDANVSTQSCVQPVAHVEDDTDCDDTLADINPSTLWYADADGDGFGTGNFTTTSCTQPSGYLLDGTDCDDGDLAIHPSADEYCDSIDQDCDGDTNDPESLDLLTWHTDADGDGFGDPASPVYACLQPAGTIDNDDDCSDVDDLAFPFSHEPEIPNDGIDQDCDGYDVCRDLNCDAWPDIVFSAYDSGQSVESSVYFGSVTGYDDSDSLTIAHRGTASSGTGDFNGDGYLDLVLNGYYGSGGYYSASTVYYGSSSGLDTSNTAEVFSYGTLESCIGDLNDDGFDDLVQSAHYDGNYYTDSTIFWGSAIGVSDSDRTSLYTNSPHDCEVEDLNQDGYLDIFFPAYGGYRSSYIYWGDANGVYDTNNRQDIAYLDYTRHANVEDVNSDGYPDLVFGSYYSNSGIYYGSATGYSTLAFESFYQLTSWDAAAADLDGDGLLDIVSCQYANGASYSSSAPRIYWNTGTGYSDGYSTVLEANGCMDVEITDVNQDGYPDIFFLSHVSGTTSSYFYTTTSHLYYGSANGYSVNNRSAIPNYGSQGIEISDLNDDGFPDLVLGNNRNSANLTQNDSVIYWGGSYGWGWSSTSLGARGIRKVEIVGSWTD